MKKLFFYFLITVIFSNFQIFGQNSILVEAESFTEKGGWVVDPQFVEQMGSPYLLAHGMGIPVEDAHTNIIIRQAGEYHIWARTKNWAPGNWEAPGRFYLSLDGNRLKNVLGTQPGWNWEYAGSINLTRGQKKLSLQDLTGFEGRCDAIYLTMAEDKKPVNEREALNMWRAQQLGISLTPNKIMRYDLVVVGGGTAGCAASILAAEKGMKVALVQDRPILGGNASSEVRVHTLGENGKFERIIKMIDTKNWPNGSAEALEDDEKRHRNIEKYDNINVYCNFRAYATNTENQKIISVDARHTSSGELLRFEAPLFVDCTGDGWIGYWAGAEYLYGREAVTEYNEAWDKYGPLWSPHKADNLVLGSTLLFNSENAEKPVTFPKVPWAIAVSGDYVPPKPVGTWDWEFSRNDLNQIEDAEAIRDHLLRAIYGGFFNYRQKHKADSLLLKWVGYILGKRESRRLVGDYLYTFHDVKEDTQFEDGVVFEIRSVPNHFQSILENASKPDFLAEVMFYRRNLTIIPYRSLYSKNISNLFMAGRNFSCTHVGLNAGRDMNTTAQMGAAVGLAASLCKKYSVNPRDIYMLYLKEYMDLIESESQKK